MLVPLPQKYKSTTTSMQCIMPKTMSTMPPVLMQIQLHVLIIVSNCLFAFFVVTVAFMTF